jgi:hypothetical protein
VNFWILQSNPKLYDIDRAVEERPIIYWRIPQYTDRIKGGDRALIWRAGQQAGVIGWGVFCTAPALFDLAADPDPFWKGDSRDAPNEYHAPVRVWPGGYVPKAKVASDLPEHRIVTAPMGTVFPLSSDDLAMLQADLDADGYDLGRAPEEGFKPLPVLTEVEVEPKPKPVAPIGAKITPALFLLSSTPEHPVEITIEGDALRLLLVEREAVKSLDETWDAVGMYLLIGRAASEGAAQCVYVGKAQALRSRVSTGHDLKSWSRCLLIKREGLQPFNASDISWLERRLIDVLLEAPAIELVNKAVPPTEVVPDWKAEILERTVIAALGVLAVLGAYVA